MKIADILHTKGRTVHSVLPRLSVGEVVKRLDDLGVGALLVCDANGAITGIVSERDVVRALATSLLALPATEAMTRWVRTPAPRTRRWCTRCRR